MEENRSEMEEKNIKSSDVINSEILKKRKLINKNSTKYLIIFIIFYLKNL